MKCYGRMYEPEPTIKCLTCKLFNKCREIGVGVPVDKSLTFEPPSEPVCDEEIYSEW